MQSIVGAWWWAVVTMTTVGYGDVYPVTAAGKAIGMLTMVTGLLVIAYPITIIGVNLNDIYEEYREKRARQDRALARIRVKELASAREQHLAALTTMDLTATIAELRSAQAKIHEEMNQVRHRMERLQAIELHTEAIMDHLDRAHASNQAVLARSRRKAVEHAGLAPDDDDEETLPMMAVDYLDAGVDPGAGVAPADDDLQAVPFFLDQVHTTDALLSTSSDD